ncbi:hypothetical protein UPYG_G00119830 [Umbra pygmaea]|uniref:Signal-induced proliferation-associated 1-like protein C-terminal domain-containing protein n=1 Tax=Umbra pygmaea TaxID=75934 RepID=A0ABD0XM18_UMBPY
MSTCSSTQQGWHGDGKGLQGVGLDVLFSSRDLDAHPFLPNDLEQHQQAKSHYACPRAPPRSLYDWGTYSPPPQRPSPNTESRGGPRPASLNQCRGYHAHTLPRRGLAVFKPGVYISPQGCKSTSVDKPPLLRATITSSCSDFNQPCQLLSQDLQQQSRPSQQQAIKPQHQPSLSPETVYQPSLSPKPVYNRQTSWQHKINTVTDGNTIDTNHISNSRSIKSHVIRQVDMTSQNVFGQPRILASLRCPNSSRKTQTDWNMQEALKRLIVLDNTSEASGRDAFCHHSLSTEVSLGSGSFSQACSPVSDCPELDGLEDLSASELSLTEGWDLGHDPLPDPSWILERGNLINVAKAYGDGRTMDPVPPSEPKMHGPECGAPTHPLQGYNVQPRLKIKESLDVANRLHHLEALLSHLESNLEKERQDKVALVEEVTVLREANQRLWEESLSSNEQLRKLSLLFNVAPGMTPREQE